MLLTLLLFLTSTLSLCTASFDDDEIAISVGSSHHVTLPGENVTLTCRVQGHSPSLEDQSVSWIKSVNNEDDQWVSANDVIKRPFSNTKRYHAETIPLPSTIISILNIYDVRPEDGGYIGCFFSSFFKNKVFTKLQIAKLPSSIDLVTNADGRILFSDDQLHASCTVTDVIPVPHVIIQLGGKVLDAWCVNNVTTNVKCSSRDPQSACPVHLSFNVLTVLTKYKVSYLDDGHLLSCEVNTTTQHHSYYGNERHHHYHDHLLSSRSYAVNVRYAPIFNCSRILPAELHIHNLAIECLVNFNPKPHHMTVWWQEHVKINKLHVNEIKDGIFLEEVHLTSRKSMLRLVMREVTQKLFTTFHFLASNDVNTSTHSVQLRRMHSKPVATEPKPSYKILTTKDSLHVPASSLMHHASSAANDASRSHSSATIKRSLGIHLSLLLLPLPFLFSTFTANFK